MHTFCESEAHRKQPDGEILLKTNSMIAYCITKLQFGSIGDTSEFLHTLTSFLCGLGHELCKTLTLWCIVEGYITIMHLYSLYCTMNTSLTNKLLTYPVCISHIHVHVSIFSLGQNILFVVLFKHNIHVRMYICLYTYTYMYVLVSLATDTLYQWNALKDVYYMNNQSTTVHMRKNGKKDIHKHTQAPQHHYLSPPTHTYMYIHNR